MNTSDVISIIALLISLAFGLSTIYKTYIEEPKIKIYPSYLVQLVYGPDKISRWFNLPCNLVNEGAKVGTIHLLSVKVETPKKDLLHFDWSQFYRYENGYQLTKDTDPYPISVNSHDSKLVNVQFELVPENFRSTWVEGEYVFTIEGWVNLKDRQKAPNALATFHITVNQMDTEKFPNGKSNYTYVPVKVKEWSFGPKTFPQRK